MNIVMFTNTYLPHVGGVARSVDFFAQDLRKRGHRVLVAAPHFEGETGDDEHVLRVPAIQNFNGSDFSVRIPLPFVVEHRIHNFKPDIIHSHHPFLMGDTALRTARKHGLPLVFTHHTMYEQYTHYVPLDSERLRRFVIHLVSLYTDFCDRVVAPSHSIAGILRKRGVTTLVVDIPTGVDTNAFASGDGLAFREAHQIPAKAEVIGHLGRLALEKNLEYLARAVAECIRSRAQTYFLVAGCGPSEDEIVRTFNKAGAGDRLIMAGEQRGRALIDAYHAMDLFVFASQSETQGMVLIEAMAAGVPVIALDAPGSREVIEDDVNGRLLPAGASAERFARTVAEYFEDTRRQQRLKEHLSETARFFSRENCARRMAEMYADVLENRLNAADENDEKLFSLDHLVQRLKIEWDLLAQKTQAAAETIQEGNEQGSFVVAGLKRKRPSGNAK